jgi:predicted dehydrogenase
MIIMNKLLKFGVIGYGFMGKTHGSNIIRNPNAELKAIFTLPEDNIQLDGVKIITDDWKKVIDDPEVDAIVIATPTTTHKDIAVYAANAKKHIFLEKPMAREIDECTKIINAATENNVKLFVAHVVRFWPSYKAAYDAVQAPSTNMIKAQRMSTFPWSDWFKDEKQSGGCILDLSIHDLDYSSWLMNKKIETIYCEGRRMPEINVDNWGVSMTTVIFEDKSIAHCEATWAASSKYGFGTTCEIIGTEGIIKFDSGSAIPIKTYGDSEMSPQDPFDKDGYYLELDSFIQSVLNDTPLEITGEDGRKAVAICLNAIKSATLNQSIKFEEEF